MQRSPLGQWFVRTLAGEGESIFEGIFSIRKRLRRAERSMAEAYGWGKLFGIFIPWIIDLVSRIAGINVYGVEGFYRKKRKTPKSLASRDISVNLNS